MGNNKTQKGLNNVIDYVGDQHTTVKESAQITLYSRGLMKQAVAHFLLSCGSTVCSFWKTSGGRKGHPAPSPSESTLRFLESWMKEPGSLWVPDSIAVSCDIPTKK